MNKSATVAEVLSNVSALTEGLTISGGEPFMQARGLRMLLQAGKEKNKGLSVIVYTGFGLAEIKARRDMAAVLPLIDVLVAGPYDPLKAEKTLLPRGSTNQTFHFFSSRYSLKDLYLPGRIEVTIGADGSLTGTGFASFLPKGNFI
jgi:anaerobic ribonucleoside-triphosphate reductase activating protein